MAFNELPREAQLAVKKGLLKAEEDRQNFGHVSLVSAEVNGYRMVAIGSQVKWSKNWKTPADFFSEYLAEKLTDEWTTPGLAEPYEKRHPILQWYHDLCEWQRQPDKIRQENGLFGGIATGSVKAFYSVAYDLYTLEHLSLLEPRMLRRLRNKDQFHGARYELYVIATLLRAGFEVELEDETDGSSTHCELSATHKQTGRKFSIEAKTCGRPGLLGKAGQPPDHEEINLRIYRQLQKALLKDADHERIVFIDVNMPPDKKEVFDKDWFKEAVQTINKLDDDQSQDDPYPAAFIFLTNNPNHYVGNDDVEPGQTSYFTAINRPEFADPDGEQTIKRLHPEIGQIWFSVVNHTKVPNQFDD